MDQKLFMDAEQKLKASLSKDPQGMLALVKSAELCIRNGDFSAAFEHAKRPFLLTHIMQRPIIIMDSVQLIWEERQMLLMDSA